MLDLAILGLLNEGPLHGYELKRQLAEYGFWQVSFGSLYPALRRLERRGFIAVASPPTRGRKVYRILPEGMVQFLALLEDESADYDEEKAFTIRLAFFRYLDPEQRIGVLERRRARLQEQLARARESMRNLARPRRDRYVVAVAEKDVERAESDIAWLDRLIEAEREERATRRTKKRRRRPQPG